MIMTEPIASNQEKANKEDDGEDEEEEEEGESSGAVALIPIRLTAITRATQRLT